MLGRDGPIYCSWCQVCPPIFKGRRDGAYFRQGFIVHPPLDARVKKDFLHLSYILNVSLFVVGISNTHKFLFSLIN